MRKQALNPSLPRIVCPRCWRSSLLALLLLGLLHLFPPPPALAAEVLQVRKGGLLQVGDGNRSFTVRLACQRIDPEQEERATARLRRELPRRARVNLHPLAENDGQLLAKVTRLGQDTDLSSVLIAAGLAVPMPCPGEPPPTGGRG